MYHLFIGVSRIYVFDNNDEPTYEAMFARNERVTVIHFPWTTVPRETSFVLKLVFFSARRK